MNLIKIRFCVKAALVVGALSILWGVIAPMLNYHWLQGDMPGYRILLDAGIYFARLFSEEIDFWAKLGIVLFGPFILWFTITFCISCMVRKRKLNTKSD